MSAAVHSLTIEVDDDVMAAAKRSLASVASAFEQLPPGIAQGLFEGQLRPLILGDEAGGLVRCEPVRDAASGAVKFNRLGVLPDERYLELVSAIAAHIGVDSVRVIHGWPILSLGGGFPSVAEGGGDAIAPSGGLAA